MNSTTVTATSPPLTPHEALSGIFGSISLASWIVVLVPQLAQNYINSSADSISLAFLCIWFAGDVANLTGALWARLVPTVTALAVYFCFADAVLIAQCLYYRARNRNGKKASSGADDTSTATTAVASPPTTQHQRDEEDDTEDSPLLSRHTSPQPLPYLTSTTSNLGLPGSRRRTASSSSTLSNGGKTPHPRRESLLAKILEEPDLATASASEKRREWIKNIGAIIAICIVGTAGWAIAYKTGAWTPAPSETDNDGNNGNAKNPTPIGAEILGYLSAIAYLGARIPQILKNWRSRSCEGLSLLFFLLSLLGNVTYGAGILFHSTEGNYVITNLPWLIGSLGTMVEDVTIFVQFHLYGEKPSAASDGESAVV